MVAFFDQMIELLLADLGFLADDLGDVLDENGEEVALDDGGGFRANQLLNYALNNPIYLHPSLHLLPLQPHSLFLQPLQLEHQILLHGLLQINGSGQLVLLLLNVQFVLCIVLKRPLAWGEELQGLGLKFDGFFLGFEFFAVGEIKA